MFVDYNQNTRDHTMASAYSVRGNPRGTVSAPIRWSEIDDVGPDDFTIATMPARFADLGDLHAEIDDVAYRLDTLLEWADREDIEVEDEEPASRDTSGEDVVDLDAAEVTDTGR
ncbi:Bifunctional non-homologous end joining protein LigD [Gordonia insulae]|uniref:Bifunctional non-homologous end joining protein LigD n=1 Tax=Gordonia insulae TaxID=2420509 RepID=A0A3G8JUG0_9ACTN|nr:Bifunctional non-homologous end joining protein LigD [Gordonia insulae]